MKKLIYTFIMFSFFVIAFILTITSSFAVHDMGDMKHEMVVGDNINYCSASFVDCTSETHECCLSPFENLSYINISNLNQKEYKKIKIKSFNLDLLSIFKEYLEFNNIDKLNSPPEDYNLVQKNNNYLSLIGIIKSNC